MPEITLQNLPAHVRRHEPLVNAVRACPPNAAIRVQLSGLKLSSFAATMRQIFPTLIKHQGAGLMKPELVLDIAQVWKTHKIRLNQAFVEQSVFLLAPQTFNELIHLQYSSAEGYSNTLHREKIAETRIRYAPMSATNADPTTAQVVDEVRDVQPSGQVPYSEETFIAFLQLKNCGHISSPVLLLNPPPFATLPKHDQYENVVVVEDDGKLLLL